MSSDVPLMTAGFIVTEMEFDPHVCTRHFGVEPTDVRTKGDIRPGKRLPVPKSSWTLDTEWARFDSTDAVIQLLLRAIWPKRNRIRDFVKKRRLKITFVLNMKGGLGKRNFLYEFSPRTIEQIRYFRASLNLDVY
jgi:hypothetical protein